MGRIDYSQPENDDFLLQIQSLYRTLKQFNHSRRNVFDFSNARWICPLNILPIAVLLNTTGSESNHLENDIVSNYLNTVCFPKGQDDDLPLKGSYIPILKMRSSDTVIRERMQSAFQDRLAEVSSLPSGAKNAVYYPISELMDNISEHSKVNEGYIFGQYYRTKEFFDVCIVDNGRGLTQGYKDERSFDFTDQQSIRAALKGISIKNIADRGFGLRTSIDVITGFGPQSLSGECVVISGNAGLYIDKHGRKYIFPLREFYWQGVIIGYRFYKPTTSIDIYSKVG